MKDSILFQSSNLAMVGVFDVAELIRNPPFELSDTDKAVLHTAEEDFIPHTWEELKSIIGQYSRSYRLLALT